jgi:hypothetical protein
MVQVPVVTNVSDPPLVIVHTPVVEDVNDTANDEVEVAVKVGVVPKFCAPGFANAMVCDGLGATEFVAPDAELAPALLLAVTVKV